MRHHLSKTMEAKATTHTAIVLNLSMTQEEANLLAAMLQNPLSQDEGPQEAKIRRSIFEAIKPQR